MPDSMARRKDSLEEGVYERLRDLERRQKEIRDDVIGRVDGLECQLGSILSLLAAERRAASSENRAGLGRVGRIWLSELGGGRETACRARLAWVTGEEEQAGLRFWVVAGHQELRPELRLSEENSRSVRAVQVGGGAERWRPVRGCLRRGNTRCFSTRVTRTGGPVGRLGRQDERRSSEESGESRRARVVSRLW
ncbi:uncharacterized protein A4U43_C06F15530 [Asparagus officinalis]|uniref:Uncharacterized protein n=1 Tax=Asparagus officinalis TaxID=4686 RepID=A0A5P1EMQ7_ASPOF|nr:uncharacterized protein A4U43_C06F15530 [Asparagus officinalis]